MSTSTEHLLLLIKETERQCKVNKAANPRECDRELISGTISHRASRILDALATILVSREQSEVIAVGLQCDEPNNRVILTIAANNSVQPQTISHAEKIWNCLQELGNDCHRIQQQNFGAELAYGERDTSPKMVDLMASGQSTQAKIIHLKRRVYQFSFPKLLSRFSKEKSLRRFHQLEDIVEKLPHDFPKMTSLLASLQFILQYVRRVYKMLGRWHNKFPSKPKAFFLLSGCLDALDQYVSSLFEDRSQKADLEFIDHDNDYKVSRYLRKIIISTNSINALIKFAYSPRMRTRFLQQKSLVIRPVPNKNHLFVLPETMQGFENIALEALKSREVFRSPRRQPGSSMKALYNSNRDQTPTKHVPVHCECAVALQLLKNAKAGESPSLSYVGVSKLSCFACWKFFESLREFKPSINIRVGGTHGKCYYPWKFPDHELAELFPDYNKISHSFYIKIADRYADCIKAEYSETVLDSSTGSISRMPPMGEDLLQELLESPLPDANDN